MLEEDRAMMVSLQKAMRWHNDVPSHMAALEGTIQHVIDDYLHRTGSDLDRP